MQKRRRIFVGLLVLCILFTQLGFCKTFMGEEVQQDEQVVKNEPEPEEYTDQEYLLDVLRIINLKEFLSAAGNVTRAELCEIAVKLAGVGEVANAGGGMAAFNDVDSSHPKVGYIAAAADMNLISGTPDGKFSPDDPATYAQAIKVIVSILGYDQYANGRGGFPAGYLLVAAERKMLDGVSLQLNEPVTRSDLVKMLGNSLDQDIMKTTGIGENVTNTVEKDKTLLTEIHQIFKVKGQVNGTSVTMLTGESNLADDVIEIDKQQYRTGTTEAQKYLGYHVIAYVKQEDMQDRETILYIRKDDDKDAEITVDAEDISEQTTVSEFYYRENENDDYKKARISGTANLIYNGKASISFNDRDLKPEIGSVTLIDANADGVYDVILTTEYVNYIVDTASDGTKVIYGKYNDPAVLWLDGDVEYSVSKDGAPYSLQEVKEWDVLGVKASKDADYYEIIVTSEAVSGIVTEVSDDETVIDGQPYEISESFQDAIDEGKVSPIGVDDEGSFYLDHEGKIAAVDSNTTGRLSYGYIMDFQRIRNGVNDGIEFEMFLNNGSKEIVKTGKTLKLNDIKYTSDQIEQKAAGTECLYQQFDYETSYAGGQGHQQAPVINGKKRQIVAYELDKDGLLTSLYTAVDRTDVTAYPELEEGRLLQLRERGDLFVSTTHPSGNNWYRTSNQTFETGSRISDRTYIIVVPKDVNDDDKYKLVRSGDIPDNFGYSIDLYDNDDFNLAQAAVVYDYEGRVAGTSVGIAMFSHFAKALDENGEETELVYFYSDGQLQSMQLDGDSMYNRLTAAEKIDKQHITESAYKGLKKGMLFRYIKDRENIVQGLSIYFKPNNEWDASVTKRPLGIVRKVNDKMVAISVDPTIDYLQGGVEPITKIARVYSFDSKTQFYYYNGKSNKVVNGTAKDINVGDTVYIDYQKKVSNVYIFTPDAWAKYQDTLAALKEQYPVIPGVDEVK